METDNTIIDAQNLAEELTNGFEEDVETSDLSSLKNPTGKGMEFTVQMNGYTLGDFEELVIRTAAHKLLDDTVGTEEGGRQRLHNSITKQVNQAITTMIDASLENVTREILQMPMQPERGKDPVSVGGYISMIGRDYLTEKVKSDGTPARNSYDYGQPRINSLIRDVLNTQFKKDLEASVSQMLNEVRKKMTRDFEDFVAKERERIATALGYEVERKR